MIHLDIYVWLILLERLKNWLKTEREKVLEFFAKKVLVLSDSCTLYVWRCFQNQSKFFGESVTLFSFKFYAYFSGWFSYFFLFDHSTVGVKVFPVFIILFWYFMNICNYSIILFYILCTNCNYWMSLLYEFEINTKTFLQRNHIPTSPP